VLDVHVPVSYRKFFHQIMWAH